MRWPIELRVWQEDENPYPIIEKWLAERGIRTGQIGVEATTRYVFYDGLRHAATSLDYTSGDPITVGCRAQKALTNSNDAPGLFSHCEVYKAVFASLREGMTQREVSELAARGYARMGLQGEASVFFGLSSALPHGSREEQVLCEGVGVMIDDGTTVEGYQSDVTRWVFSASRRKNFSTLSKSCAARKRSARRCRCWPPMWLSGRCRAQVIVDAGSVPVTNTSRIAWATASAWTAMNRRIWSMATPRFSSLA